MIFNEVAVMSGIERGLKGEQEMVVGHQDLASVMGNIGAEVLSTHRIVLLMELAARNAIEGRLPEGIITVGMLISIRHFAATPRGLRVRAVAYLREIKGRTLVFDVVAYDEFEKIAEGQNEHLMVSADKFLERTRRKTAGAEES
jgi:predicted thioesterase